MMENNLKGKKLLVLAGAGVHVKVVKAAKEMGIYTIVTDYNKTEDSPAKQIADEVWDLNITEVDAIVEKCRAEKVDGVLNFCIDPAQKPYQQICEKLGLPCIGTKEQFDVLTDKRKFKDYCIAHNVDVIPDYTYEDIISGKAEYPLFIKPTNSRGSRGQSVCYNKEDALTAVEFAKSESSDNGFICEKYIENAQEFQVTYFFDDGKPYLIRTADSYCGPESLKLNKVVSCAVSPSFYTDLFLQSANQNFIRMLESLGIKNGPVFAQGFIDNNVFRVFDPGFRFPGVDYELVYKKIYDIDIVKKLIYFSIIGHSDKSIKLTENSCMINHNRAAVLFPNVISGKIFGFQGFEKIKSDNCIVSVSTRYGVGDIVYWSFDVNQRVAEIDIVCDSTEDLKEKIDFIQETFKVYNEKYENMIYNLFDTKRIV